MKGSLAILLLVPLGLLAQEQFGAAFSNYTPTNSVFMNPSSMLDAKTWLDIHIVGAGAYGNNNFVSVRDNNLIRIMRTEGESVDEEDLAYNYNRKKFHGYNYTFARVLSGVWSQGDHAAGLFFSARSFNAVRGIPEFAARFIENGIPPYTQQHNIDYQLENIRASSLAFGEIQLSYAYTFYKKRRDMLMAGISIKKFLSYAGGAANIYNMEFNVRSDSLITIYDMQADGMYTPEPRLSGRGGLGLDIGVTWQRMLGECSSYYPNDPRMGCRYLPYKYKVGFSIMDMGSVKFEEDDRQFAGYDFQSFDWYGYADTDIDEDNALDVFASQEASIDEGRVKKTNKIRLPTFISLQGDYNIWASRLYANASIVQGIPTGERKFGIRRANSLMVGLRYETKFFDVSLPLSLYEYRTPQVGLAIRLWFFTIGTDKLFHLFGNSDLYGGDIYAHIKIPFFYHPKCKARAKAGRIYDAGKIKRRKDGCDAYY